LSWTARHPKPRRGEGWLSVISDFRTNHIQDFVSLAREIKTFKEKVPEQVKPIF